jgi:hypothetical protein
MTTPAEPNPPNSKPKRLRPSRAKPAPVNPPAPAVTVPAAQAVQYSRDTDGNIFRTEAEGSPQHLATIVDGIVTVLAGAEKYVPRIVRYLDDVGEEVLDMVFAHGAAPVIAGVTEGESIPPAPAQTIRDGDKTPAFVEWLKKYHPDKYATKFGIIGPGTVTKWAESKEPITGKPIRTPYTETAILSHRKTHLTEKPDASTGGGQPA